MFDILIIIFWSSVDLLKDVVRAYEGAVAAALAIVVGIFYYAWTRIRRRQALAREGAPPRAR